MFTSCLLTSLRLLVIVSLFAKLKLSAYFDPSLKLVFYLFSFLMSLLFWSHMFMHVYIHHIFLLMTRHDTACVCSYIVLQLAKRYLFYNHLTANQHKFTLTLLSLHFLSSGLVQSVSNPTLLHRSLIFSISSLTLLLDSRIAIMRMIDNGNVNEWLLNDSLVSIFSVTILMNISH